MTKVYIAGKITGNPNYKADFQRAAEQLEREHPGVVVINPAALPEGMRAADYMSICIPMLYAADIAAFLPSYQESKGAKIEMALCEYIGKPHIILEAGDGLPCGSFVAIECVNGHCPDIPSEYDEQEYSKGIKCSECGYNTGKCDDCALPGSGACPKEEAKRKNDP